MPVCLSPLVSPLKWQFRSVELRNYFDTCGVGSNARPRPAAKRKNALPERCTTRAKPHLRSFDLKVGSLEHQDASLVPSAPFETHANGFFISSMSAAGVAGPSARFGVGGARSSVRRHGEVLFRARRGGQEGGAWRSSLRRAPVGKGAEAHDLQPGGVFGVSAWAKTRWHAD